MEAKAEALVRAYCAVADEDWLLFSFHLLQLHHFLPYYQEDGRDPVTLVEDILKRAMMDLQLPPGDPYRVAMRSWTAKAASRARPHARASRISLRVLMARRP